MSSARLVLLALTLSVPALIACKSDVVVEVASQKVELCDLKKRNADPEKVPCLVVDLDVVEPEFAIVWSTASVDGERVAESDTGLYWIPIETIPNAETMESIEVTFETGDKDGSTPAITKLTFEIPPEFQEIVKARVGAQKDSEQAQADYEKEASRPTFEINDDGDRFSTRNIGGCYGYADAEAHGKKRGINVNFVDCPDTVAIEGKPVEAKNLISCAELYTPETRWSDIHTVSVDVSLTHNDEEFSGTLRTTAGGCIWSVLDTEGGLVFKGESDTAPEKPRVIQVGNELITKDGREQGDITLGEIDWVSDTETDARTFECNYGKVTRTRRENDETITLRDRRTGKVMATRKFKARKGKCDKKATVEVNSRDNTATAVSDKGDQMSTHPSGKAVTKWLQGYLE